MVATETIRQQLRGKGLTNLSHWSRGVDIGTFLPDHAPPDLFFQLERPIQLYVGRVAVEKNIEAFAELDLPGTKVIIGDGPQREELQKRYPDVKFLGARFGEDALPTEWLADLEAAELIRTVADDLARQFGSLWDEEAPTPEEFGPDLEP